MALKQDIVFRGIAVRGAYLRVSAFSGDKGTLNYTVSFHTAAGSEVFDTRNFSMSYQLAGSNPVQQAYLDLKAMPEFESAQDC